MMNMQERGELYFRFVFIFIFSTKYTQFLLHSNKTILALSRFDQCQLQRPLLKTCQDAYSSRVHSFLWSQF